MQKTRVISAVLAVVAAMVAATSPAQARVLETTYYTISVQPRSASSPSLFLGTANTPRDHRTTVTLKRYDPDDRSVQWTPVWPSYPGAAEITGGSTLPGAILDFLECLKLPCDFAGPTVPVYPLKLVNRYSGRCMAILPVSPAWRPPANGNGVSAAHASCLYANSGARRIQTWQARKVTAGSRVETTLAQPHFGRNLCLDVRDFQERIGAPLQVWACHGGTNWNQHFRFLRVAVARCEIGVTNKICGLPGSPPNL